GNVEGVIIVHAIEACNKTSTHLFKDPIEEVWIENTSERGEPLACMLSKSTLMIASRDRASKSLGEVCEPLNSAKNPNRMISIFSLMEAWYRIDVVWAKDVKPSVRHTMERQLRYR